MAVTNQNAVGHTTPVKADRIHWRPLWHGEDRFPSNKPVLIGHSFQLFSSVKLRLAEVRFVIRDRHTASFYAFWDHLWLNGVGGLSLSTFCVCCHHKYHSFCRKMRFLSNLLIFWAYCRQARFPRGDHLLLQARYSFCHHYWLVRHITRASHRHALTLRSKGQGHMAIEFIATISRHIFLV